MSTLSYTPGPWEWVVNKTYKQVTLVGHRDGLRELVMDFVRWGMNGAKPRLNCAGLMRPADGLCEVIRGREHHASWCQTINHPDARLIAAAPDMLDDMIWFVKRCRSGEVRSVTTYARFIKTIESATGLPIKEVLK